MPCYRSAEILNRLDRFDVVGPRVGGLISLGRMVQGVDILIGADLTGGAETGSVHLHVAAGMLRAAIDGGGSGDRWGGLAVACGHDCGEDYSFSQVTAGRMALSLTIGQCRSAGFNRGGSRCRMQQRRSAAV